MTVRTELKFEWKFLQSCWDLKFYVEKFEKIAVLAHFFVNFTKFYDILQIVGRQKLNHEK